MGTMERASRDQISKACPEMAVHRRRARRHGTGAHISASKVEEWIEQHFYDIQIVRVTRTDYPAFEQVVFFGKKRNL